MSINLRECYKKFRTFDETVGFDTLLGVIDIWLLRRSTESFGIQLFNQISKCILCTILMKSIT